LSQKFLYRLVKIPLNLVQHETFLAATNDNLPQVFEFVNGKVSLFRQFSTRGRVGQWLHANRRLKALRTNAAALVRRARFIEAYFL
ncbi:MAG: hypothetical protein LUG55_08915, partial [Clostridiales bacterium]|nr:hypothetical protein [Clostridiales bacterium]